MAEATAGEIFGEVAKSMGMKESGPAVGSMSQGCKMEVKGNILTITVDLTKNEGRSASGKTIVIASSHGNTPIVLPDGNKAWVGVNVYKK